MKKRRERIVMLTAYDATMARLLDQAGVDLLLVGDSLGNVILGLDTTIPVTLDAMIHHTRAVAHGVPGACRCRHAVSDVPGFGRASDAKRRPTLSGGRRSGSKD